MTTLLHYKVVVRDTLEYALPKDSYELNLYNEKKRSVLVELDENTPLRSILNNSGDNGKNLEKIGTKNSMAKAVPSIPSARTASASTTPSTSPSIEASFPSTRTSKP